MNFTLNLETHPAAFGMGLLKQHTSAAWLRQPEQDMDIFAQMPHIEKNWYAEGYDMAEAHCYDANASYLGAAAGVSLGVGEYQHNPEGIPFDGQPGLWHIYVDEWPIWYPKAGPPIVADADAWEYTPLVAVLLEMGAAVRVGESYTFPEAHQVLRPFYAQIKAYREATAPGSPERDYVKRAYAQTFGMLAHAIPNPWRGYLYRPDWWNLLQAHAKANLLRRVWRAYMSEGAVPIGLETDKLFYPRPVVTLPIGSSIGQFKYERGTK